MYADEKGVQVFALYGVGDGTEATSLYAVGGKKAASAAANMKEFENGGYQHDGNTETALSWIRSVSRSQGNGRGSIRETSRGGEASANDGDFMVSHETATPETLLAEARRISGE